MPMGMFQMLVLANGQRNLLRVPGGVGDGVGPADGPGVDNAVPAELEVALALGVSCGVAVADGATGEVCPSAEPGESPTVGLAVAAVRACACPHAATASAKTMHSARTPPCRGRGAHHRAGAPDSDVCLTPT
ncbi:MAG: hypothetical protein ABSC35_14900 [Candidatus Dormibacteria bacterium]